MSSIVASGLLGKRGGSLIASSVRRGYVTPLSRRALPPTPPLRTTTAAAAATPIPTRNYSSSVYTYNRASGTTEPIEPSAPPKTKRSYAIRILVGTFCVFVGLGLGQKMQVVISEPIRAHVLPDPEISDPETLEVESLISSHPIVQELRSDPTLKESRPHLQIPMQYRAQVMTSGVLSGPNRIVVPPFVFHDGQGKSFTSVQYLGKELCGHPGIIHGGLLATILDEGLARCAFLALPNHVAMTASLEVNYRAPCMAEQAVVLKATTTKVEGRKAWVEGKIETLDGKLLVEAKALMIEPRHAKYMRKLLPSGAEGA